MIKPTFTERTETTATGTYLGKAFDLRWIEVDCSYEVDGDFTDEERAVIATVFEVSSVIN
jgi:hypothetical protein